MKENLLRADENKKLIGKRAKFKDYAEGYSFHIRGKTGKIVKDKNTPYLYLFFDEPYTYGYGNSCIMKMCIINEGSFELI